MRKLLIVTYDISNPKRLRKVFKAMKGFGQHLQLSVFRCDLTDMERFEMIGLLQGLIHHDEDQILLIDLGASDGRTHRVDSIGRVVPRERREPRIF
ncbi:MAG: CRISPR-associated endonuclease Cas2 [Deltaproteobacteria bacterium]|nr:CRISPR-associated endonuclease Cas2 [Deltaproteobacteria bacterium]